MSHNFKVQANEKYEGPNFDEYCIAEQAYLPANRDRSPCLTCPLEDLCQAGFEEQVRLVVAGEDPSLTKSCALTAAQLTPQRLFENLREEQIAFVKVHVPNL